MTSLAEQDAAFSAALRKTGGSFGTVAATASQAHSVQRVVAPAPQSQAFPAPLDPNAILLGETEHGAPLRMDLAKLVGGRLLVQGISDAGKSWTLRRLLEETAGRIQQIVIDPEGEFDTLAEELGYLYVEARRLDAAAIAELATNLRRERLSVVMDFSEWGVEGRMEALAAFVGGLIECPQELWTSAMVAIDEAHLFAPYGGADLAQSSVRKASINAVVDLMSRGRKRGLCGVLATQRLARLSKSVASDLHNFLIGKNTLDLDVKRASETIGWPARKGSDRLPILEAGNFIAVGPAFSHSPAVVKIGSVRSRHKGRTPAITPPATASPEAARQALGIDGLVARSEESKAESASAPTPRASGRGRPPLGWTQEEDAILATGLAEGATLLEISARLHSAGFRARVPSSLTMHARAIGLVKAPRTTRWSPQEDEIIIAGYAVAKSLAEISRDLSAAGFDRAPHVVGTHAVALGVTNPDRQRPFTEREKEIVRLGCEARKPRGEILAELRAEGFERSINSISKIAQRWGYGEKPNSWTEPELELLRRRYAEGKLTTKAIAAELGRPVTSVVGKAHNLGISKSREYSSEERRRMVEMHAAGAPLIDIVEALGRPYTNVAAVAHRMGLSFKGPRGVKRRSPPRR